MIGDLAQCEASNGGNRCTGSKGHLGPHGISVGGGIVIAPWPNAGLVQEEFISKRLQGFPDDWTKGGKDAPRYRTLGNAVTVPVAAWIAGRILNLL